jgi:hypothetical protein
MLKALEQALAAIEPGAGSAALGGGLSCTESRPRFRRSQAQRHWLGHLRDRQAVRGMGSVQLSFGHEAMRWPRIRGQNLFVVGLGPPSHQPTIGGGS